MKPREQNSPQVQEAEPEEQHEGGQDEPAVDELNTNTSSLRQVQQQREDQKLSNRQTSFVYQPVCKELNQSNPPVLQRGADPASSS